MLCSLCIINVYIYVLYVYGMVWFGMVCNVIEWNVMYVYIHISLYYFLVETSNMEDTPQTWSNFMANESFETVAFGGNLFSDKPICIHWDMFQIRVSENPMLHHNFPRSSSKCSIPGLGCKRKIKVLHKHLSQATGCVPGPDSCCMCKDQLCVCAHCYLMLRSPNFNSCVYPHVYRAVVKTWVIFVI